MNPQQIFSCMQCGTAMYSPGPAHQHVQCSTCSTTLANPYHRPQEIGFVHCGQLFRLNQPASIVVCPACNQQVTPQIVDLQQAMAQQMQIAQQNQAQLAAQQQQAQLAAQQAQQRQHAQLVAQQEQAQLEAQQRAAAQKQAQLEAQQRAAAQKQAQLEAQQRAAAQKQAQLERAAAQKQAQLEQAAAQKQAQLEAQQRQAAIERAAQEKQAQLEAQLEAQKRAAQLKQAQLEEQQKQAQSQEQHRQAQFEAQRQAAEIERAARQKQAHLEAQHKHAQTLAQHKLNPAKPDHNTPPELGQQQVDIAKRAEQEARRRSKRMEAGGHMSLCENEEELAACLPKMDDSLTKPAKQFRGSFEEGKTSEFGGADGESKWGDVHDESKGTEEEEALAVELLESKLQVPTAKTCGEVFQTKMYDTDTYQCYDCDWKFIMGNPVAGAKYFKSQNPDEVIEIAQEGSKQIGYSNSKPFLSSDVKFDGSVHVRTCDTDVRITHNAGGFVDIYVESQDIKQMLYTIDGGNQNLRIRASSGHDVATSKTPVVRIDSAKWRRERTTVEHPDHEMQFTIAHPGDNTTTIIYGTKMVSKKLNSCGWIGHKGLAVVVDTFGNIAPVGEKLGLSSDLFVTCDLAKNHTLLCTTINNSLDIALMRL